MGRTAWEGEMILLGREQLKAAQAEDWDRWESIAAEREALYRQREAMGKMPPLNPSAARELRRIDRAIVAIIEEKKGEVLTELARVRQARRAHRGYKAVERKGRGYRGIKITC